MRTFRLTFRGCTAVAAVLLALSQRPVQGQSPGPAEISLRAAAGASLTAVELGDRLALEVVLDARGAEVTGFSFQVAYDSNVFRLREPDGSRTGDSVAAPFVPGDWLGGVVLRNAVEVEGGQTYLVYAEVAGVQRQPASGSGVAARFILEAIRRPLGDTAVIRVVSRGHDRRSAYTTVQRPGEEQAFGAPLAAATVRITGFQIQPLPDLEVVEGDGPQVVIDDLDRFVDQEGAQVIWAASFVDGLGTTIDTGNGVTMDPVGLIGDTTVVFSAFEVAQGNAAADTVRIRVRARPRISGLPPQITFPEDGVSAPIDLDAVVEDLDDPDSTLTWRVTNGSFLHVDIDPGSHLALFRADPDVAGEGEVRLVVTDAAGLSDTVATRVVVTPVNDGPVIQHLPPVYPRLETEGRVSVALTDLIVDPDDDIDSLQVLLQTRGGVTAQLSAGGDSLVLMGLTSGRAVVDLTVQDRAGLRDQGRLVAVVLPAGASLGPVIAPLPQLRFTANSIGTLDLNRFVRDDGPVTSLAWTPVAIDSLRPVVRDGVLVVNAATGFTGTTAIGLLVTDPQGNQDAASLAVEVVAPGVPQPPLITAPPMLGLASGPTDGGAPDAVHLDLDALVDDPDGQDDEIQWTVTASSGLRADFDPAARTVDLTPTSGFEEAGALTLTATDKDGLTDTRAIPVLVVEPGGAPLILDLQDAVLDSAGAVSRLDLDAVSFDDEDLASELAWAAVGEPGIEIDLDPATHLLRVRRADTDTPSPPEEARIVLTARDTGDQERSAILTVRLPPLFQLQPIPDLFLFAGGVDTSLVLSDVVVGADAADITWSVDPPTPLTARVDSATTRTRVASPDAAFVGAAFLRFTATDGTGRARTALVRVTVRGRGLSPQVRSLPAIEVRAGETDHSLDLDEYVVDDDPDSMLVWSVSQPADVTLEIDALTHEVAIRPADSAAGPRTVQLVVRDPAGNTAVAVLALQVLRGGEAPVVGPLPQILLPAGGPESVLSLDLFVVDADTPDEEIAWTLRAEAGVASRLEGRRLLVSIPAGQRGTRQVFLTATDPQGNRAEGALVILIQEDDEAPVFAVEAQRNDILSDLLELTVRASEPLDASPQVVVDGTSAEVVEVGENTYVATVPVPPVDGTQSVRADVTGRDRAGNPGSRHVEISLRRIVDSGGSLRTGDGGAQVNIPDGVARPGRVALLYPLAPEDLPDGVGPDPGVVYRLDVAAGAELDQPVVLNLFAGARADDPTTGVERWDPETGTWQDVPAAVDADSGWLSAALTRPGLYRVGQVAPQARRTVSALANFPNPFRPGSGATRIEYEVSAAGPVRLEMFNVAGQRVRVLVDEASQEVGVWNVDWDGRDHAGQSVASGVYLYRLQEAGATHVRRLLLVK